MPITFDLGIDTGTPVTDEYKAGARFTGKIKKVIDLFGERHIDPEAESKAVSLVLLFSAVNVAMSIFSFSPWFTFPFTSDFSSAGNPMGF